MKILGIEVVPEEGEDGRWAIVRFHGSARERVVVRLAVGEDLDIADKVALVDRAKMMLLEAAAIESDDTPTADGTIETGGFRKEREAGAPVPSLEEEDDNAFQEPDEALPDEREEAALRRRPSGERQQG